MFNLFIVLNIRKLSSKVAIGLMEYSSFKQLLNPTFQMIQYGRLTRLITDYRSEVRSIDSF